eukprot:CAMPEP_0119014334 /NCGR_PEP_ID=MMETSP1176-20130426/9518_1 /TAXON_ID=265551 /ORGANISM="Synedropsis recta cf, Strain CCMP1620" /LENGTH=693 /DNA_ID=CAMNT_0006967489 /DNA_START=118 /DNA_END=2199 /DNA_ORIENTATION=+
MDIGSETEQPAIVFDNVGETQPAMVFDTETGDVAAENFEVDLDAEPTDVPVHDTDVGISLPDAEELKMGASTMTSAQAAKKYKIYGIIGACLLVLIIGLSAGLSGGSSDNSTSKSAVQDGSGGDGESLSVTVDDNGFDGKGSLDRYNKAFHILSELSGEDPVKKRFSPQNRAANWITNGDSKQLPIPTTLAGTSSYSFVQRYVLAVLYYEWDGSDWTFGSKFLSNEDECDWNNGFQADVKHHYKFGASCSGEDQRIAEIFMPGNDMAGSIPMEIGHLTHLTHLSLYGNSLTGALPNTLVFLTDLNFLAMESNKLTGELPDYLTQKLQYLALGYNKFEGKIPSSMSQMQGLIEISFDNNQLTGKIDALTSLPNLKRLYLGHNKFDQEVDETFLEGSDVEELDLSHNAFSGSLPEHFFNEKKLKIIDISENQFTGGISEMISENKHIRYFSAYNNEIGGEIPFTISRLTHLTHLDLSGNKFSGKIPNTIANMTRLEYLFLANNNLLDEAPIPDYTSLVKLEELSLKGTHRTGRIPTSISTLTNLVLLDLGVNKLTGKIPKDMQTLTKLKYLVLNSNKLNSTITVGFEKLESIDLLLLDDNKLTGGAAHVCGDDGPEGPSKMSADCSEFNDGCECCTYCCSGDNDDDNCYENEDLLANIDLEWEQRFSLNSGYDRSQGFVFSENIEFRPKQRLTEN